MPRLKSPWCDLCWHGGPIRLSVVWSGGLGDTVLVLPTVRLLLGAGPDVQVTLIGSAWAEALAPLLPAGIRVVRFDSPLLTPLFGPGGPDPTGAFAGADGVLVYTREAEAPLVRNLGRLCHGPVVTWPPPPVQGVHAAVHLAWPVAQGMAGPGELPEPGLAVPGELRAWADGWLSENSLRRGQVMAVHPGSGGRHKCWPAEHFAQVMGQVGGGWLVFEGPADAEACGLLEKALSGRVRAVIVRGLEVARAAALLEACRAYLGNDSGLSHVAAALGVPSVVVFGPTDPRVWSPLGRRVQVVGPAGGQRWPKADKVLEAVLAMTCDSTEA